MPRIFTRLGRQFVGRVDCPNCGAWCTAKQRNAQRLPGFRYWLCPGCQSLLKFSALSRLCDVLAGLLFTVVCFISLTALIDAWLSSRGSEAPILIGAIALLAIFGVIAKLLTPLIMTISGQSRARVEYRHGTCRKCGFDLRGGGQGRCPECGTPCLDVVQAYRRKVERDAVVNEALPVAKPVATS